ncbi:MAG: acyl-CoA thioesterase/BAAT N-terminal domain-containing protein [Methanobacterium sp.]|uniref:acyl-CoA thioesterase/bile acid-CoA:amino acid N-acyltransferase family protein n=1 Tax=Methanobacterium sp. TaxID=2164 RepID=UPI003D64E481|nr:acyl-CoA thioesterase/BAAT N-terminal domain-containing protein [Methanobacterium sp.]
MLSMKKGEFTGDSRLKVLIGEEIRIKITDLPPKHEVKIHTRRKDDKKQLWYSSASYISDNHGLVDSDKSESISGSYTGVDPIGLFYSMETISSDALPENLTILPSQDPEKIFFYFDVELDGEIVAFKYLETVRMLPNVQYESLEKEGLVANFYHPEGENLPAVLVVSGSEGGIATPDIVAGILASKGYAALALAFFEMPGLPEILEEIPLDYVEKAVQWLSNQPMVNPEKMVMIGTSKGAELTLLSASLFPQIKGVVATSPSCTVFQGINQDPEAEPHSSWTYKGKNLTFVPFVYNNDFLGQFASCYPEHLEFLPLYKASFENETAVQEAAINVEKIQGPVLLISSDDDRVWPSKEMSERITERLKSSEFPFKYEHLSFDGAGHLAGRPGYMPWPTPFYVKGGTPQINGNAQVKVWKAILKFLEDTKND